MIDMGMTLIRLNQIPLSLYERTNEREYTVYVYGIVCVIFDTH